MTRDILLMGIGHLCFECHQVIQDGMITGIYVGRLPIYYHTACLFDEDKIQTLKWATQEGEIVDGCINNELIEGEE